MQENIIMPRIENSVVNPPLRPASTTHPLLAVLCWELRRQTMSRFSRVMIVLITFLFGTITWAQLFASEPRVTSLPLYDEVITIEVLIWIFLMFVPPIVADLVTRDYKQRMRELLMATALPNKAYIWGRYLAGLCICMAMTLPGLLVQLASTWLWPASYVAPNAGAVLGLWLLIVLPAILTISGLSFSLSTLLPRLPGGVKLVGLIPWVIACQSVNAAITSRPEITALQWELAHNIPDLASWIWPRIMCMLIGIGSVTLTARFFKRFNNVLK